MGLMYKDFFYARGLDSKLKCRIYSEAHLPICKLITLL